jgi:hypothetical protein
MYVYRMIYCPVFYKVIKHNKYVLCQWVRGSSYSIQEGERDLEKIKFRKFYIWRSFCSPGGVEASFGFNGGRHRKENMAYFLIFL